MRTGSRLSARSSRLRLLAVMLPVMLAVAACSEPESNAAGPSGTSLATTSTTLDPGLRPACARSKELSDLGALLMEIPQAANQYPTAAGDAAYASTEAQIRSVALGLQSEASRIVDQVLAAPFQALVAAIIAGTEDSMASAQQTRGPLIELCGLFGYELNELALFFIGG